jgi:hypothetical protein
MQRVYGCVTLQTTCEVEVRQPPGPGKLPDPHEGWKVGRLPARRRFSAPEASALDLVVMQCILFNSAPGASRSTACALAEVLEGLDAIYYCCQVADVAQVREHCCSG